MNSIKNVFNKISEHVGDFVHKFSDGLKAMPTVSRLKNQFKIAGGVIASAAASMILVQTIGIDLTGTLTALGSAIGAVVIALDGIDNITRSASNSAENNNQNARALFSAQKSRDLTRHAEDVSDDFSMMHTALEV